MSGEPVERKAEGRLDMLELSSYRGFTVYAKRTCARLEMLDAPVGRKAEAGGEMSRKC